MARKKLFRIQESMILPNVIQHDDPEAKKIITAWLRGAKQVFLELGCGRGEYTLGLSERFKEAYCIGVDIQGERMWHGAKQAVQANNERIIFLRAPIPQLAYILPPKSVDAIWLPFPDPFPRKKQAKKRLTSPRFLQMYPELLKPKGVVHLKTDNEDLFGYSKEIVKQEKGKIMEAIEDVYGSASTSAVSSVPNGSPLDTLVGIQTQYEKRYRQEGKKIFYLAFCL